MLQADGPDAARTLRPGGGEPAQSLAWQTWGLFLLPAAVAEAGEGWALGERSGAGTQEEEEHSDLQEQG